MRAARSRIATPGPAGGRLPVLGLVVAPFLYFVLPRLAGSPST
jgi:hypothetical protein